MAPSAISWPYAKCGFFALQEYLEAYRYKQLILVLSEPVRRREYPPEASYFLGEAYRLRNREGDLEPAKREYTLSTEMAPTFAPAYRALGLLHYKQHQYDAAAPSLSAISGWTRRRPIASTLKPI